MNKDNKNMIDEKPSDMADKAPLSEQELEEASGGFTLFDTCKNCWDPAICKAIWGRCSHLQMNQSAQTIDNKIHYLVSCSKGCFMDVSYTTDDSESRITHRT